MDYDEHLDMFFIRKENYLINVQELTDKHKKFASGINHSKSTKIYVPLMLKHVKNLSKCFISSCDNLQLRHCLVYGKIISKGKEYKSNHNYVVDDGTSTLNVTLFNSTNNKETIWKMESELNAIKKEMVAQNKTEIVESLQKLLLAVKKQMDNSNLTIGSNVLLCGKPVCYRGQYSLNVYSFIEDGKSNRDIEIHFKDYLIKWYSKSLNL